MKTQTNQQINHKTLKCKTRFLQFIALITLLAFMNMMTACNYYFKVIEKDNYTSREIQQADSSGNYVLLVRDIQAWHIYDLEADDDTLSGKLDAYLVYFSKYLFAENKGLTKYEGKEEPDLPNSLQIYTSDTSFTYADSVFAIPFSSIDKVTYYIDSRAAHKASWLVPLVVIPSAILIPVLIIGFKDWQISIQ